MRLVKALRSMRVKTNRSRVDVWGVELDNSTTQEAQNIRQITPTIKHDAS
jgi:hypothetical protein